MAFAVYHILCLVIFTHTTYGLLSDYKFCGDTECESRMSRVQAIKDHYSTDCRFLSFRKGDIIFVYHKLSGMREDLWAGTIDRKFGYFPKQVVTEEEIYSTSEILLKTQKSDFFCIDKNGYPVDPSELDDNVNDLYPEENINRLTTTTQHSLQDSHPSTVYPTSISGQDTEEVKTLNEQAESPSWLGSSVTGLWELVQKDDSPIPKMDKKEVLTSDQSLTSSVTGWLGYGAKESGENSQVKDTEASSILGSSMTGWLGINTKAQTQSKENHAKRVEDDTPLEVFRSRKIAINLQDENQVVTEEKKAPGTLDWIGKGISSTLGFGQNTKESTQKEALDEMEKKIKPASSSWFDIGITDMLGFKEQGTAERVDQIHKEDSPPADQDSDAISSTLSQKQLINADTEIEEGLVNIQIDKNSDTDTEMKQRHREDGLQTLEANTNENEMSQASKEKNEDGALPANCGPSHGFQVACGEYNQDTLRIEPNRVDTNSALPTENVPEMTQMCSESHSHKDQELITEEHTEIQEEIDSIIKVIGTQKELNEKTEEEIIETKQNYVGQEMPKAELKNEEFGETETIVQNKDQIKENIEQHDANHLEKEEQGYKLIAENGEEQKNEKVELKDEELDLGGAIQASKEEDNPSWQKTQNLNANIVNIVNEMNYINTTNDDKENSQLYVMEDNNIKETLDSISNDDLEIKFNNDQDSKNNLEKANNGQTKPNFVDSEQNVYGFNSSLVGLETVKPNDEIGNNLTITEEVTERLEVNRKSSNINADPDKFEQFEEEQFAASQKETVIKLPDEATTCASTSGEMKHENQDASRLMNNAFAFFNTQTSLNSETVTEESQVTTNSQMFSPSLPFLNVQSPTVTTVSPKNLYQNILTFINANELEILIFHFGEHKMQFMNFILGNLYSATGGHDADMSIVLDIERLLNYHMGRLLALNIKDKNSEEDKEAGKIQKALQKLELVLGKVKESYSINVHDKDQEQVIWKSKDAESINEIVKEVHRRSNIETENNKKTRGKTYLMMDFHEYISSDAQGQIQAALELITWITVQVVSALPDDIRPGPDLYGVPWEPVIIAGLVGIVTVLVFVCRCYSSVKSRMYRSKERWMAEQVAQLLDEKCKVLETLSKVQQEYNEVEDSLRDSGILAQTQKTIQLEAKAKQLERSKREFESDLEVLKDQLNQQRKHRFEQEQRITALEESITACEEETKMFQSQEEQGQTTLKVYSMNCDRLQRNLETAGEENTLLHENNTHLRQQLEGWAERVSELEEEMRRCEHSHSGMLQDVATKDERIMSLTDRLLQMKAWDSDLEVDQTAEGGIEASNGTAVSGATNGRGAVSDSQGHLQKVQKLIQAAKLNADLKSVDEDKDRIFAKLNDEVKAKDDLQESIKDLENEKSSLQSDTLHYTDQVQVLQQKLQIMTEMYQENELKLHRLLTVEEKERLQKEEKLTKADKNIAMAMEELNNYRQRAEEMEEELEKTKQSYQTQISSHEKKAHNNWLAARSAERDLAEIRRENALLRQKLTDTQFKLEAIEKDPYALDSLARPLPFRGRPASETRAFLSPPTLMDGPTNRLSPRVVMRGQLEPPVGLGDMERTGGAHSDSGSISPIWERDRRGPPQVPMPGGPLPGPLPGLPGTMVPPGYIFSEQGVYRRPPPGPMGPYPAPGPFPPRASRPPGPPADMTDGSYRENSLGPGEPDHREPVGVERRTPPETDLRMGSMLPPGPTMGPMDGPFPRRAPYGPPPPEYFLPRGPGGPPMPVWGPPPGMMFPRFPPGGPPPSLMTPHSGPSLRPLVSDGHPPPSVGPPQPTQRQLSEEHTPSPQDMI